MPAILDLETIAAELARALGPVQPVGARIRFVYPELGALLLDATGAANLVTPDDGQQVDCTITIRPEDHVAMLTRRLDQARAFREGRMLITGDVAIAYRLRLSVEAAQKAEDG